MPQMLKPPEATWAVPAMGSQALSVQLSNWGLEDDLKKVFPMKIKASLFQVREGRPEPRDSQERTGIQPPRKPTVTWVTP